jgi:hypothetical protein
MDFHLGSDDMEATHALLLDQQEQTISVGPIEEVEQIIRQQHPRLQEPARELSPEDLRAIIEEHFPTNTNLSNEEMRNLGINEWFLGQSPAQREREAQLLAWLDRQVTRELIQTVLQDYEEEKGERKTRVYEQLINLQNWLGSIDPSEPGPG